MTAERRYGRERSPDPPEETMQKCPVCGQETEMLYVRFDGEIAGCEMCLTQVYAEDKLQVEDFSDDDRD